MLSRISQLAAAALVSLALFWLTVELAQHATFWLLTHTGSFHKPAFLVPLLLSYALLMAVVIRRNRTRQLRTTAHKFRPL